MKLDTVSVAPPGPRAVTLMTMSASFSWKITLKMTAVMLTGSMSGNVIFQNVCQGLAPSTFAASETSAGSACSPARSRIMMKGIRTQASMAVMLPRATHGEAKKAGLSQPRWRASVAAGPKRYSTIDLPIIQLTATGLNMRGNRKATLKNLRARISALSSKASANAIAYCTSTDSTYQIMLPRAFQKKASLMSARILSRPLKWRPVNELKFQY